MHHFRNHRHNIPHFGVNISLTDTAVLSDAVSTRKATPYQTLSDIRGGKIPSDIMKMHGIIQIMWYTAWRIQRGNNGLRVPSALYNHPLLRGQP